MIYLWTKILHLFFVIAWMACVFYLPRILVNVALTTTQRDIQSHLFLMGRKLYRFGHIVFGLAFVFGVMLWLGHLVSPGFFPNVTVGGWMHAKISCVFLLLAYYIVTGKQLKKIEAGSLPKSVSFYRWFNEFPLLLLLPILYLVIAKPF
jgi:putative membrane protein